MIWKLFAHELFKYFGDNRQNIYWSKLSLRFQEPCLKAGVVLATLKELAILMNKIPSLNWRVICSAKKFAFSFKTLTGVSLSCTALLAFKLFISLSRVLLSTGEK